MEPESTETPPETTENSFGRLLKICCACKENVADRQPKLLPCLHGLCDPCIQNLSQETDSTDRSLVKCPACGQESALLGIIDNVFVEFGVVGGSSDSGEEGSHAEDEKICTACEENTPATAFCRDCSEWLCDQCVEAHRRVRITKDHTVQPKESVPKNAGDSSQGNSPHGPIGLQHCPVHRQELLKLFCDTCDRLTCRDCQLVDHKDHKYQFLDEAAQSYKQFLNTLLGKVREKQTYVENAKALIERRNSEIGEKEERVINDVKSFAMRLITEVNRCGKSLLADLQAICTAKKNQLETKSSAIQTLSTGLDHALKFSEFLLLQTNHSALLQTKKTLVSQLKYILRSRCEVPNPNHEVDVRYGHDRNLVAQIGPRMGAIVVDGIPFNPRRPASSPGQSSTTSSPPATAATATSPNQPVGIPPVPVPDLSSLKPEVRNTVMNRLRQMQDMHRQSRHKQQQQALQQAQNNLASYSHPYPNSGSHAQRLSHLPQQSASISSSNNYRPQGPGMRFPQGMHGPGPSMHPMTQQLHGQRTLINLAQLQKERMRRIATDHGGPVTTTVQHSPIVIQPEDASPSQQQVMPGIWPNMIPDCPQERSSCARQNSADGSMLMKHEERTSCSFATHGAHSNAAANRMKMEPSSVAMPDLDTLLDFPPLAGVQQGSNSSGSRTPTPRIESTSIGDPPQLTVDNTLHIDPLESFLSASGEALTQLSHLEPPNLDDLDATLARLTGALEGTPSTSSLIPVLATSDKKSPASKNGGKSMGKTTPHHGGQNGGHDDMSEDWCAVCNNGGDLLCCDSCPKVFHLTCHVPTLHRFPSSNEDWYCCLCKKDEDLCVDRPDDRATVGSKRKPNRTLSEREQKLCDRILLELFSHELSPPFHVPVSKASQITHGPLMLKAPGRVKVPNYHKIVTHPMDLGTIKHRLEEKRYSTPEEFLANVLLIFHNCCLYNEPESEVGKAGVKLKAHLVELAGRLIPYLDLSTIVLIPELEKPTLSKRRREDKTPSPTPTVISNEADVSNTTREEKNSSDISDTVPEPSPGAAAAENIAASEEDSDKTEEASILEMESIVNEPVKPAKTSQKKSSKKKLAQKGRSKSEDPDWEESNTEATTEGDEGEDEMEGQDEETSSDSDVPLVHVK